MCPILPFIEGSVSLTKWALFYPLWRVLSIKTLNYALNNGFAESACATHRLPFPHFVLEFNKSFRSFYLIGNPLTFGPLNRIVSVPWKTLVDLTGFLFHKLYGTIFSGKIDLTRDDERLLYTINIRNSNVSQNIRRVTAFVQRIIRFTFT